MREHRKQIPSHAISVLSLSSSKFSSTVIVRMTIEFPQVRVVLLQGNPLEIQSKLSAMFALAL